MSTRARSGRTVDVYRVLALLCVALVLASGPAPAQTGAPAEPAAPPAATPAAPPAPVAVPAAEIPARAEDAILYLQTLPTRVQPESALLEIEKAVPENEALFRDAIRLDATRIARGGLRELEDVRQTWLRRQVEIESWQATLQKHLEFLAQEQATIELMEATWKATRKAARASSLPAALEERAGSVLEEVRKARTVLNEQFEQMLSLQDRISRLQVSVGGMMNAINQAASEARSALFEADSPPLWRAFGGGLSREQLGTQLRETRTIVRAAVIDWYRSFGPQILMHLLLIIVMIGLIELMRRRTQGWPREDVNVNAAMHVLSHPIASALLVTLVFKPWIYPRSSVVIGELSALVLLIPLLIVLPGLVFKAMRKPLYVLTALYMLSRLHTLVPSHSSLDRILLLTVNVFALVGLIMLLRPGSLTSSLSQAQWWRWTLRVAKLAALALTVALVANVLGALALAELLVEATLTSALIASLFLAVVLVFRGLVTIFLRSNMARKFRSVKLHGRLIEDRIATGLHAAALIGWIAATALLFNVARPVWYALTAGMSARSTIGNVNISLGDVLAFCTGVYVAVLISRFVRFLLQEDVFPRLPMARGVPNTITMLVNYGILGLGFMIALAASGIDLSRLTILAGALGVGVGFGLQNVVANFVSGIILAFERPVQIGDTVEVGRNTGEVRRIGIRSSTIRTAQGAEVIVPNSNLVSNEVVNWSLSDRDKRVDLRVSVEYGNDPAKVVELLLGCVSQHPLVHKERPPVVTFEAFGENALEFIVRYWSDLGDPPTAGSEIAMAVYKTLADAGIAIARPRRELVLRAVDDGAVKMLRPDGA